MVIIVCGPRDWQDFRLVGTALDEAVSRANPGEPIVVLDGAAKGADSHAHYYAEFMGWTGIQYPPNPMDGYPQKFFIRNQRMADHQPKPDACLAMIGQCMKPGCLTNAIQSKSPHMTHGTADMIKRAKANDIPVVPFGRVDLYVR